jgi:hypothetical protein
MLSFSCLRGARIGEGGEDDDNHRSFCFLSFTRTMKAREKNTKMMALCHRFHV